MFIHRGNIMKRSVILGIITMAVILVAVYNRNSLKINSFSEILNEYNVKVTGDYYKLTNYQLNGLLKDVDDENIYTKYEKYMQYNDDLKQVSPKEILEIHYYSLDGSEREEFLKKIQNQEVIIDMDNNGAILISYNVNK